MIIENTVLDEVKTIVNKFTKWISVKEDLPENSVKTTKYGQYHYTDDVLIKTLKGNIAICKRSKFMNQSWKWKGSLRLDESVTHWKVIDNNNELINQLLTLLKVV